MSSIRLFPVNEALWNKCLNSFMWATARFSRNEDNSRRIIQNKGKSYRQSSKRCKRRSATPTPSPRNAVNFRTSGLDTWSLERSIRYSTNESSLSKPRQKFMYSVIRLGVLVEFVLIILEAHGIWEKIESTILVKAWGIEHSTTSQYSLFRLYL